MEQKIKWILFDVSGVIVNLILRNPDGYDIGSRHFNAAELEGFYFTRDLNNYMLGLLSHEQFIGRYLTRKKLDVSVDELNSVIQQDITPIQGMVELIETLSHKYHIALATNDGNLISKYKIEKSGVIPFLSKVIASHRIHELKPHIPFYKKTVELLNTKYENCVFIDDTKENIITANTLGMKGILFTDIFQLKKDLHELQLL